MFKKGDRVKLRKEFRTKQYFSDEERFEDIATVTEVNPADVAKYGENFTIQWSGDNYVSTYLSHAFEVLEAPVEYIKDSLYI